MLFNGHQTKSIQVGWTLTIKICAGHNKQLHKTNRIKDMKGYIELKEAIKKEYDIGIRGLPAYRLSYLFMIKKEQLFEKLMDIMMDWLEVIHKGRILHKDTHLI